MTERHARTSLDGKFTARREKGRYRQQIEAKKADRKQLLLALPAGEDDRGLPGA